MNITYLLVDGELPAGLSLQETTGRIIGDIDFSNLDLGPVWIAPPAGELVEIDAAEPIDPIQLSANSPFEVTYALSEGVLPVGLTLDFETGVIEGTFPDIPGFSTQEDVNRSGPIWVTSSGRLLGDVTPGAEIDFTLQSTPRGSRTVRYSIARGGIPWGLELDPETGKIEGIVEPLFAPGVTVEIPPLPEPVWVTSAGSLGILGEFESFGPVQLVATPASGRTITRWLARTPLPWGLSLNIETGEISGTTAELVTVSPPGFINASLNPVFSDTVVVNGVDAEITSGSIGAVERGEEFSAVFGAIPAAGRSISTYNITSGRLPLGLSLDPLTGILSGTAFDDPIAPTGVFEFTIRVNDNGPWGGNSVTRTYSITLI